MDAARIIAVLGICVPVFAVMGLGKALAVSGRLKDEHCSFINWLVYMFSLPALIFSGVARQTFHSFFDPAVILMPIAAVLIVVAITMGIAKLNGYKDGFAAAFVFGTYWANASYVGLPLSQNAFGNEGFAKAAIYNGLVIPFFVLTSYTLIGLYGAGSGDLRPGKRMKDAFLNPVVLSAVAGILTAVMLDQFRAADGSVQLSASLVAVGQLLDAVLRMIGTMGLPLALLSIGASLKWEQTRTHLGALGWTVGCKLVLLPLATLMLIRLFFPEASPVSQGVPVILASTPCAVASYVVSCQLGVERGFVSSMLVLSTALSVVTIPIWIYVVKGLVG